MKQAIEHDQMDAVILAGSAMNLLVKTHYQAWQAYSQLAGSEKQSDDDRKYFTEMRDQRSEILRTFCEKLDEAMQYIGDISNSSDAVDEHGMADAAYAAMDRALGREADDDETQQQAAIKEAGK